MAKETRDKDAMKALAELLPTMRKMQSEDNSITSNNSGCYCFLTEEWFIS